MAAPIDPSLTKSPDFNVAKNQNLTMSGNVSVKTAFFRLGIGANADQSLAEVITKDSQKITTSSEVFLADGNKYYVQTVDQTPVKFASGAPLVTQRTNVRFPSQDLVLYTPEKIATFLIFKK